MITKIIANQDAYYKWVEKKSGETSINLSQEIASFIAPDFVIGEQVTIDFTIHKDDYLRAIGMISNFLPLYTSTSKASVEVRYTNSLFENYYNNIKKFFGSNDTAVYSVNFISREDGRFYLNNLDKNGFNIREFFVAYFSVLSFENIKGTLHLRLETGPINEKIAQMTKEERQEAFFDYIDSHKQGATRNNYKRATIDITNINVGKPIQDNIVKLGFPGTLIDITDISKLALLHEAITSDPNNKIWNQTCSATVGAYRDFLISMYNVPKKSIENSLLVEKNEDLPLQQIYYGAPGTGKSFGVDEVIKKNHYKAVRTTFHPDSDYSTFVGCYKPQMETVTVRDDRGFPVKENGQVVCKKEIVYKYSPQAFLKAYVEAWKDTNSPQVLVIEEINRGNCAQIFGDIFQLLDRNKFGYSSYPIIADQDIMMHLNEKFSGLNIANADEIDAMYEEAVTEDVLNGSKLILPKNLYIWATMNTSDQSLFPIDSAFKRRWDWKYVRISEGRDQNTGALIKNTIKIDDSHSYDWWEFLEAINNAIGDATNSEDKKLGFFFCKAKDNVIDAELFVAKVIFYLWNDVFKDSDTDLFQVLEDGNQPTFDQFYTEDTMGNTIVNTNVVVKFIEKVMKGVE